MQYSLFFLFVISILCSSCQKEFSAEYRIQNNTGTLVEVSGMIDINGTESIPLTLIDTLSSITIAKVTGSEETTSDYLSNIDELINNGINELTITNINGAVYNRDPLDPSVWKTIEPIDDNDPGFILLELNPADFL